ncbi:hypothetical protein, partial [Phenylobacterium sp.]|uniref:hypothetical protein n=1 Tax=Phenylobacterium sp. TaxID=1871053 RepID=UPI0025E8880B
MGVLLLTSSGVSSGAKFGAPAAGGNRKPRSIPLSEATPARLFSNLTGRCEARRPPREPRMSDAEYVPPKIWTWNRENGGRFANINR